MLCMVVCVATDTLLPVYYTTCVGVIVPGGYHAAGERSGNPAIIWSRWSWKLRLALMTILVANIRSSIINNTVPALSFSAPSHPEDTIYLYACVVARDKVRKGSRQISMFFVLLCFLFAYMDVYLCHPEPLPPWHFRSCGFSSCHGHFAHIVGYLLRHILYLTSTSLHPPYRPNVSQLAFVSYERRTLSLYVHGSCMWEGHASTGSSQPPIRNCSCY